MTIKSLGNDGWMVDVRPQGRNGKRIRKKFATKSEAQQFERWAIATHHNKEWVDKPRDRSSLTDLIALWWDRCGSTLKDGENRHVKLKATDRRLGFPRAIDVTPEAFAQYRAKRITDGIARKTVNNEHRDLKAMFNKLRELGLFHDQNPLTELSELKLPQTELGFLTKDAIRRVLTAFEGDNLKAAKLCLSTGARWNEAARLTRDRVYSDRVTYTETKNGQHRTVPITAELAKEITEGEGRLLFPGIDYDLARKTLKRVAPEIPAGQATHVFRHTFASHFMANGGNILVLQRILGHSTINQTMVYAHFSPDHLADAVTLNPLVNLD